MTFLPMYDTDLCVDYPAEAFDEAADPPRGSPGGPLIPIFAYRREETLPMTGPVHMTNPEGRAVLGGRAHEDSAPGMGRASPRS